MLATSNAERSFCRVKDSQAAASLFAMEVLKPAELGKYSAEVANGLKQAMCSLQSADVLVSRKAQDLEKSAADITWANSKTLDSLRQQLQDAKLKLEKAQAEARAFQEKGRIVWRVVRTCPRRRASVQGGSGRFVQEEVGYGGGVLARDEEVLLVLLNSPVKCFNNIFLSPVTMKQTEMWGKLVDDLVESSTVVSEEANAAVEHLKDESALLNSEIAEHLAPVEAIEVGSGPGGKSDRGVRKNDLGPAKMIWA